MNKLTLTITCLALSCGSAAVRADHNEASYRGASSQAFYDYAKVVDVDPIVTRRYLTTPHEECHVEKTGYYREVRRHNRPSFAPILLGSIIGGVVGHQFGDGNSRKVLTAAGALVGGSIAHHSTQRRHGEETYQYVPRTERHCTVVEEVTEIDHIEGYNVTYRYKGNTFVKRTERHPGERIRIRVEVTPAIAGNPRWSTQTTPFRFRSSTLG
jgi:uncharacterized protein YcfJ